MIASAEAAGAVAPPERLEIVAPAKLNLALLVGPRRRDGYHEVFSLMLPVSLADVVTAERVSEGVSVLCDVCPGEGNLAARAVRALEEAAGRSLPLRLTIEKRIPHGAGLGGGSSDAAAALRAADRLYDLRTPTAVLYRAAAGVGADVPFFLWPGPQIAMGRGTALSPLDLPGPLDLVVAAPELVLPTADVYGWRDAETVVGLPEFAARTARLRSQLQAMRRPADLAGLIENDLQPHVVARHPVVGDLIASLREQGALAAAMSGSGSSVFGLFDGSDAAADAAAALRAWSTTASGGAGLGGPGRGGAGRDAAADGRPGLRVFQVGDLQPLSVADD